MRPATAPTPPPEATAPAPQTPSTPTEATASQQLSLMRVHATRLNELLASKGEALAEERRRTTKLSTDLARALEEAAARTAAAEEAKVVVGEHVGLVTLLRYRGAETPKALWVRGCSPTPWGSGCGQCAQAACLAG